MLSAVLEKKADFEILSDTGPWRKRNGVNIQVE